jgi:hypothetical protein
MTTTNFEAKRPLGRRLLRWILFAVILVPASLLTGTAVLNYTGYCFEQSRYLTDDERIRSTVEVLLLTYPRITYAYDQLPKVGYEVVEDKSRCCGLGDISKLDESKGGVGFDARQLILYSDIKEFYAINPDCCQFARRGLYGELVSIDELWPKITGYSAGFVSVKYRVRYRDEKGDARTKFSGWSANQTNCGRPVSPLN